MSWRRVVSGVAALAVFALLVAPSAFAAPVAKAHVATAQGYNNPIKTPKGNVAGATLTAKGGVLATSKASHLPFTGAQLALFAIVGIALVGGGVLLKATTRGRSRT